MPHVAVKMYPGRSETQKAALADAIVGAVTSTLGDGAASVSVSIEDVSPTDWMTKVYAPDIEGHADRLFKRPGYGPLASQGRQ